MPKRAGNVPGILQNATGLEFAGRIPVNPVSILLPLTVLSNRTPATPFDIPPHNKQTGLAGLLGIFFWFVSHQVYIVDIFMGPCPVCNGAVGMDKLPGPRNNKARGFRRRYISVADEGGSHQYRKYTHYLHLLIPNVSVHRTAHFVRRTVQRLVGPCVLLVSELLRIPHG